MTPGVGSGVTPAQTEELPLLDIPFMLISFLMSQVTPVCPEHCTDPLSSQVLAHSLVSVLQSLSGSVLGSLASHLASLIIWTAQFVW